MDWRVEHGDCLAVLREIPDASVDALITDPPYSSGGFTRGDRTACPDCQVRAVGAGQAGVHR